MNSQTQPDWFTPLDHTADTGMIVTAPDLPELFGRCALGMMGLITEVAAVKSAVVVDIEVDAEDLAELLVRWLTEVNYLHTTQHLVFHSFELVEFAEFRLRAVARGEVIEPERHLIHTEIKAVTFHGLHVRREGEAWQAQVIFDL